MRVLMFGRGVIATLYGHVLEAAGHEVHFYVRPGRAAEYGDDVGMDIIDARRWPGAAWLFPLGLVCAAIAAVGFLGMLVESPVGGLVQRLLEGSILAWIVACAFALRRGPVAT